jgi:hypothetical protein
MIKVNLIIKHQLTQPTIEVKKEIVDSKPIDFIWIYAPDVMMDYVESNK